MDERKTGSWGRAIEVLEGIKREATTASFGRGECRDPKSP